MSSSKSDAPKTLRHRGAPRCAQVQPRPMMDPAGRRVTDLLSKTLPHLPRRMISSDHHNTVCFASHLRGDMRQPLPEVTPHRIIPGKLAGSNCVYPPPRVTERNELSAAGDYGHLPRESSTDARKLKIRGLKNFVEKRNNGAPPSWVKEFPCRSRFHPDMYLYNFEEGPLNPKRNVEALSQCQFKGGRCSKCGIYTGKICGSCNHCEADCSCPEKVTSRVKSMGHTLKPFGGMPSVDSFGETLSKAQEILTSSHNAPKQYPFRLDSPERDKKGRSEDPWKVAPPPPPANQIPFFPPYPSAFPPSYSGYPYGYPPLPYMTPPPPPPGYGYPYVPPIPIGYSHAPYPYPPPPPPHYGYPYQPHHQTFQQPPPPPAEDFAQKQKQPTSITRVLVNNDGAL